MSEARPLDESASLASECVTNFMHTFCGSLIFTNLPGARTGDARRASRSGGSWNRSYCISKCDISFADVPYSCADVASGMPWLRRNNCWGCHASRMYELFAPLTIYSACAPVMAIGCQALARMHRPRGHPPSSAGGIHRKPTGEGCEGPCAGRLHRDIHAGTAGRRIRLQCTTPTNGPTLRHLLDVGP